jgi:carboxypeptidase PM20D1
LKVIEKKITKTLDDKSSMIGQLEALHHFIARHGQPRRSLFLAYGHDEEVSGTQGASAIARFLGNVSLEYVIDEGTMIIEDLLKGMKKPVGLISVADKGYMTVKFYVNTTGGHSSVPSDDQSPIFILAESVNRYFIDAIFKIYLF